MIYISIPVHEKIEIIIDQSRNFKRFFPEAKVLLHLSKQAEFSISKLEDELHKNSIDNTLVNPTQVETSWGNIINAHIENIKYIIKLGNGEKIIFHSSNDMLVKDGLSLYISNKNYLFHRRKIDIGTLWWVGSRAMKDKALMDFFNNDLMASQIEGSMYKIDFLKRILDEIVLNPTLISQKNYPLEEVLFSSFAKKFNVIEDGLPYVFSEVHRFDQKFFSVLNKYKFLSKNNILSKLGKKFLEKLLLLSFPYKLSVKDINAIRNNNSLMFGNLKTINDSSSLKWKPLADNIFAVKRVSREFNSIRKYIQTL